MNVHYVVVNKQSMAVLPFEKARTVALHFWGRDILDYVVVKKDVGVVDLGRSGVDITEIERVLEAAQPATKEEK